MSVQRQWRRLAQPGRAFAPTSSAKAYASARSTRIQTASSTSRDRRRRRRPDRAAVQSQRRLHFAAPVHDQRDEHSSRHGGGRALRRALDRQPRFRRERRARRGDEGDISALVAFQATLPPPTLKSDLPEDWRTAAARGAEQFTTLGCASCHISTLPLKSLTFTDPAPYDMAGLCAPAK